MSKERTQERMHHDPQFYRIRNHLMNFLDYHSKQMQTDGSAAALQQIPIVRPGLEAGQSQSQAAA